MLLDEFKPGTRRSQKISYDILLAAILVFCLIAFALAYSPRALWRALDSDQQSNDLCQVIDMKGQSCVMIQPNKQPDSPHAINTIISK